MYQRTLVLREHILGPEHPQVAFPLKGLADLACQQGAYVQAESLYQRALAILEGSLGSEHSEHPDIARILQAMAHLSWQQGCNEQAHLLMQRAYCMFAQCLGQAHPETVKARETIALPFTAQTGL